VVCWDWRFAQSGAAPFMTRIVNVIRIVKEKSRINSKNKKIPYRIDVPRCGRVRMWTPSGKKDFSLFMRWVCFLETFSLTPRFNAVGLQMRGRKTV
jgi:hypothetical protein